MAALMFQIANNKHPDITRLCPDLSPGVQPIIDRLLEKDVEKRFQTGGELKGAIINCMNSTVQSG